MNSFMSVPEWDRPTLQSKDIPQGPGMVYCSIKWSMPRKFRTKMFYSFIYYYFCQVLTAFFFLFLIFRFPHDLLTKTRQSFRRAGQNLGRGAKNPHCAFVGRRLRSDLSYCHPRPLCWNVLKIATDANHLRDADASIKLPASPKTCFSVRVM